MSTATTIRDARQRSAMTQQQVADLVACTQEAVSLWERDIRHPRPLYARRLERALGLPDGVLNEIGAAD